MPKKLILKAVHMIQYGNTKRGADQKMINPGELFDANKIGLSDSDVESLIEGGAAAEPNDEDMGRAVAAPVIGGEGASEDDGDDGADGADGDDGDDGDDAVDDDREALMAKAKELGIKGLNKNTKIETIKAKISEAEAADDEDVV